MATQSRQKLPQKLEQSVKKVLSKNGCATMSVYDVVFYEVPSEGDLGYIAQTMQDWHVILPALGLSFQDGKDIEDDRSLTSPGHKRIAVLTKFCSIHGIDATYNKLMLAFNSEQKMNLVTRVVEKAAARWKNEPIAEDVSAVDSVPVSQERNAARTPSITAKPLNVGNIMEVLTSGGFPAAKCVSLGLKLGVQPYVMHNVQSDRVGRSELQLADILEHWLNNDLEASWYKLADAVGKCGNKKLAFSIRGEKEKAQPASNERVARVPRRPEGDISGERDTNDTGIRRRVRGNVEKQVEMKESAPAARGEMEGEMEAGSGDADTMAEAAEECGNTHQGNRIGGWHCGIMATCIVIMIILVLLALEYWWISR